MALSDISIADLCADTVLIMEDWDELLQVKRRVSPPSYDSTGEMVDAWANVGDPFLGDWQPVSGGTMRAEAALKIKSDAVSFGPCGINVVQGDRIYRADLTWEYVNRVIVHEDHFEIYMTKTKGSL